MMLTIYYTNFSHEPWITFITKKRGKVTDKPATATKRIPVTKAKSVAVHSTVPYSNQPWLSHKHMGLLITTLVYYRQSQAGDITLAVEDEECSGRDSLKDITQKKSTHLCEELTEWPGPLLLATYVFDSYYVIIWFPWLLCRWSLLILGEGVHSSLKSTSNTVPIPVISPSWNIPSSGMGRAGSLQSSSLSLNHPTLYRSTHTEEPEAVL